MPLALLCDVAANREACGTEWLVTLHDRVAPCHRHVVHHPLLHVLLMYPLSKKLDLGLCVLCILTLTQFPGGLVLLEGDLKNAKFG